MLTGDDELGIINLNKFFWEVSMTGPLREPLEFVFLWWSDKDHGVILSRAYHTLVSRFCFARRTAQTWGEFLTMLGDGADFVEIFMQCDDTEPQDCDRIQDLRGVWVLEDFEFPLTQCAQESFQYYGSYFPRLKSAVTIRTEYGMPILLYPKFEYLELKRQLVESGHRISEEMAPFPMSIYSY